jgi:hypothetical protein
MARQAVTLRWAEAVAMRVAAYAIRFVVVILSRGVASPAVMIGSSMTGFANSIEWAVDALITMHKICAVEKVQPLTPVTRG